MINSTVQINSIQMVSNFENTGFDAILCDVINTENDESVQMLEWVNNGKLEYTDSHLQINGYEALKSIGLYASVCDDVMEEVRIVFENFLESKV